MYKKNERLGIDFDSTEREHYLPLWQEKIIRLQAQIDALEANHQCKNCTEFAQNTYGIGGPYCNIWYSIWPNDKVHVSSDMFTVCECFTSTEEYEATLHCNEEDYKERKREK